MKGKKQQKNKRIIFILLGIFTAIVGIVLSFNFIYQPTKTYHSKFLKITIDYPANFELEERFGTITLKNERGEIKILTNGTNYETIEEYLENLSKLNSFTITNIEKKKLKYEDASVVTIDNKKDYFFYPTEWSVYIISASSPSLYPDLDQVAKSFRYEP